MMTDRAWNLLCRAIQTRLRQGEELDAVLAEYGRLTEDERKSLRERFRVTAEAE